MTASMSSSMCWNIGSLGRRWGAASYLANTTHLSAPPSARTVTLLPE